ncbi:MAG: hypothetical protein SXV54_10705 [Chloroflexota bacterium]|nr:hypothetical protein [Chloroflexota bacterium]
MQEKNDSPPALSSDQLLYRSQFILGPSFIDEFKSWKRIRVNDSIYLTVHPNLSTSQAIYRDKSITLLGFMLDPDNSEVGDFDIVSNLVRSFFSCDDLFRRTTKFGGRWILIANDGRETRLFNDATGLRQVYYTDIHQAKDIWCASQPGIVARMLNLQMDEEAVDFINYIRFKKEYWWPGDSSPYKEIKHLLPNHYLNLETGHCYRYWPSRGLNELSLDEAIEKISRTLSGLMQSASNRFDLALALSSGWDSRLVLASCREIRHRISYYSTRKPGMPRNHADIKVPSRLLSRLGLKHDIIDQNVELRGEFVEIFKKNVSFAHDEVLPRMQANLDHYNLSKVAVTGSVSEVARCHYRLPESEKVTALKLSSLAPNMEDHPFVIKFFEKWLRELVPYQLNPDTKNKDFKLDHTQARG